MATEKPLNLRELCRAASVEQNSERLMALVSQLLERLDEPKAATAPLRTLSRA